MALAGLLPWILRGQSSGGRGLLDLNGSWAFRTDPGGAGFAERWFERDVPFPREIQVPGCWQAQGVGEPAGVLRHQYTGTAWYRKSVAIPASWSGRRIQFLAQGILREAVLFVNGERAAEHAGFSRPLLLDVTNLVRPGQQNLIAVAASNPGATVSASPDKQTPEYPTGLLNYIGNWGGIYGKAFLISTSPTWVNSVHIRPDVETSAIRVALEIGNRDSNRAPVEVELSVLTPDGGESASMRQPLSVEREETAAEVEILIPDGRLWSPDDPFLYTLRVRLHRDGRLIDETTERFGLRQVTTNGTQVLLNGSPLYLRGYGDDNIEVLSGTPPADKNVYLERLKRARSFGFNAVRFHSMTPVPAYFEAADEVGMLVMAELPVAYTQYLLPHKEFLRNELRGVLTLHRNRPSLFSLALGNEFNLKWLETDAERQAFLETVQEFYALAKTIAPDTLILSNDGYDVRPTDMISTFREIAVDVPTIRHEFGEYYCSLPNTALIDRFSGVMDPLWLRERKAWASSHGLQSVYPTYVAHSERLQHIGRKYQIEKVRSDPRVSGYHYWLIVDYPGGTGEGDSWEEGWFDYFWRPKSITPADGLRLNSAVLPMIDLPVESRTLRAGEPRAVEVSVSNFGEDAIRDGVLSWRLLEGTRVVAGSELTGFSVERGRVGRIGTIEVRADSAEPRTLTLEVELHADDQVYRNDWAMWVFPKLQPWPESGVSIAVEERLVPAFRHWPFGAAQAAGKPSPQGLLVTPELTPAALEHLKAGGRVWCIREAEASAKNAPGFFPASGGAKGTMVAEHAALGDFPHRGFCELQFHSVLEKAWPMTLEKVAQRVTPILSVIRTTSSFLSKRKELSYGAYLLEVGVGQGRLLLSSLRLTEPLASSRPEAVYLTDRLLRYAAGADFRPTNTLEAADLDALLGD